MLTYYRNGVASGSVTVSAVPNNAQPLFMGGNGTIESWSGFLDDVALWNKVVPAAAIAALAANTYTPATLPTNVTFIDNGPFPVPASVQFPSTTTTPLTDDYTGTTIDIAKWEVIDQGLESTASSGITATQNNELNLSGTTSVSFWAGKSLRSVQSFSSRSTVTAEVDRVSLAGTGTLAPTGGGKNLGSLDFADAALGLARMKLVWIPSLYHGQGTIQIWRDTTLAASHSVTNWPANFKVMITGQARAAAAPDRGDCGDDALLSQLLQLLRRSLAHHADPVAHP